jgi:hypothetical protein
MIPSPHDIETGNTFLRGLFAIGVIFLVNAVLKRL